MVQFSHISGDPVLDIVNTVEWRLSPSDREEDLLTYASVIAWCRETGLVKADEATDLNELAAKAPAPAEQERLAIVAVREHAYAALFEGDQAAAAALAEEFRLGFAAATLVADGSTWRWADVQLGLATPRHRIARALMTFFGREDLDRLHQCEDDRCGWVYLDTSPRRNRRWCVTKDCGDRNRSRAYYARQKARSGGSDAKADAG